MGLGDLPFIGDNTAPRVVANLPRATKAFTNKYQDPDFVPFYSTLPNSVRRSIQNYDMKRVNRGQTPLPIDSTIKALTAARDRTAVTQPAEPSPRDFFGNVVRNVKDLAAGVVRMPGALVEEAIDIPTKGPQAFSDAMSAGNPLEIVAAMSQVPGVRMLPGAYVAGNVAEGDFDELAANPLFTALDVLPAVKKAASTTPVAKAYEAQKAAMTNAGQFAPEMNPIRANAAYKLDEAGQLQPRAITQVARAVADTPVGGWVNRAFSQEARAGSRILGANDVEFKNLISPDGMPVEGQLSDLAYVARNGQRLAAELGLDDAAVVEATRVMQSDPLAIPSLTPPQQQFISTLRDEYLPRLLEHHAGLPDGIIKAGAEFYDAPTGNRINAAQTRMTKTAARIETYVIPRLTESWKRSGDPRLVKLIQHLGNGEYPQARRMVSYMGQGKTRLERPQGVKLGKNVPKRDVLPADRSLNEIKNIREAINQAASAQRRLSVVERTSTPARFKPIVGRRAAETYAKKLIDDGAVVIANPEQMRALTQKILDDDYSDIPGYDKATLNAIADDIGKTWQKMRDEDGLNPVYVPQITAKKAEILRRSGVLETIPQLSALKERTADISAGVNDAAVAISASAMQALSKEVSTTYIQQMLQTFGKTGAQIEAEIAPAVRQVVAADPRKSFQEVRAEMIRRDYGKFSDSGLQQYAPRLSNLPDETYLPKVILDNIKENYSPRDYKITAIMDPVTQLFRTAILPLSPRWHVYNIVGNTIATVARTGPSALKYAGEARRLLKMIEANDLAGLEKAGLPREMRMALGGMLREADEFKFRAGRSLGRLGVEAGAARILQKSGVKGAVDQTTWARAKFTAMTDLSYKVNQMFDDGARLMNFLYGKGKGMSDEQAINLSRKVLQQWDEYTPIERQVLRSVFPFYGFTQHIMRFAAKYPIDHPIRASLIASITRAELEDLGTGLPHAFLNMFTIGDENEDGIQNAVSTQGLNPFSDIGNMLTLQGMLSAVNPILATGFQQLGVEDGQLELYPQLKLDPVTGRMVPDTGNVFANFVKNVIPQSEMISSLIGAGGQMKEMRRTDPDAWARTMRSGLGFPILLRTYDMPAEYIKAEVRRQEDQLDAKNDALKSGNYSRANLYPGLEGLMPAVRNMTPEQMAQVTPRYAVPAYENQITGLSR